MSFGAFILLQKADSEEFNYLPDKHECAITEIRVEQHLDKQTSFAVRFQEDFEDADEVKDTQQLFAKSTGIAICVADGAPPMPGGPLPPKLVCLVRGQVENVEYNVTVGGSGSWFEIRGQDVRTKINRVSDTFKIEGSSDEIIKGLLEACADEVEVGEPTKVYSDENPYVYRGSALDAVNDLARKSAFSCWLEYELKSSILVPNTFEVKRKAHVEPSPSRPKSASLEPPTNLDVIDLAGANATVKLQILGDETECETVVNFSSYVDNEVARETSSYGQNRDTGEQEDNEGVRTLDEPVNPDGEDSQTVGGVEGAALESDKPSVRSDQIGALGDPDIARWLAYAAATEAAWYVRGDALTTAHMLQQVLQPHEIVEVSGGGCGIAGKYQVTDVTHVINAAEHWMQVKLRSNSRTLKQDQNLS